MFKGLNVSKVIKPKLDLNDPEVYHGVALEIMRGGVTTIDANDAVVRALLHTFPDLLQTPEVIEYQARVKAFREAHPDYPPEMIGDIS